MTISMLNKSEPVCCLCNFNEDFKLSDDTSISMFQDHDGPKEANINKQNDKKEIEKIQILFTTVMKK